MYFLLLPQKQYDLQLRSGTPVLPELLKGKSFMVIGLDIDGTITRHPEFFSLLSQSMVNAGHKVIIITFRENYRATKDYLGQCGIAYSELITSTLESCFEHGVDEWKGVVCRKYGVEIFFEDDLRVIKHIEQSTLCLVPIDSSHLRDANC